MEPEVHIIEKYFQEILHCFTMTNIKCRGNKEIDLLAMRARECEKCEESTVEPKDACMGFLRMKKLILPHLERVIYVIKKCQD